MTQRRYWSKEEEQFLIDNVSKLSTSDLAYKLDRSKQQISKKLHNLGLNSKKALGILWSESEDDLLKQHFEYAPKNYLMNMFPNRSWQSILQRGIKTLKLKRISQDRYSVNYDYFSKWTEGSAYFLGFIIADGHIHYNKSKFLQIEVQKQDIDILQKLKEQLNFEGIIMNGKKQDDNAVINGNKCKCQGSYKIQINNAKIVSDLNKLGVPLDNKTYTATFPKNIPNEFLKHFMRGIIDGDGSISYNKKHPNTMAISFCGTYDVVKEVKDHMPCDCENNRIFKSSEHCWNFVISGKKANMIVEWLYEDANIFLDRKYRIYQEYLIAQQHSPSHEKSCEDTTLKPVTLKAS